MMLLFVLPLLLDAVPFSPTEPRLSPSCELVIDSGRTGPGCCDVSPPVCDYFVYHYTRYCGDDCDEPQQCYPTGPYENVLVSWYQPCNGTCFQLACNPDQTNAVIVFGNVITACVCQ